MSSPSSPAINIALDVSAVPHNPAGAGRYVYELARALSQARSEHVTLISRRDDAARWSAIGGCTMVDAAAPERRPVRLLWEQFRLPGLLSEKAFDVLHSPHYTMPERARLPVVVTIHDMTFFDHPEWHERTKVPVFRRAISKAVERATRLIAISDDTARRLTERFGELDVTVIRHGIDHDRFHTRAADGEVQLLRSAGIPEQYIACIGTIEPRKNLPLLIKAFDQIAGTEAEMRLVIAGRRGWGTAGFDAAIEASPYRDRILVTGYLAEQLVAPLLRHARAVAYPSLVEGFGLPALEAIACGAPLVAARGSAVEEITGEAALLVDPGDMGALAAALLQAIDSHDEDAKAKRVQVASRYTWEAAAEAHIDVYRKASGVAAY